MKASVRWLRELVPPLDLPPRELADRLTGAGLEVEGIAEFGLASDVCVVARVKSIEPHPTKSGLRLVTVERAKGETQVVVCGAPNVPDPGGLVVLAPLGAELPAAGLTIAPRSIGGVESEGMLCSESELGLSEESEGILVLRDGLAEPGTPLSQAVAATRDTIFEIGLTPNRPDGLGHVGLAREVAALLGLPFSLPDVAFPAAVGDPIEKRVTVIVEDEERCPHYGAALSTKVTVAPSPPSIRYLLHALGMRPISNVVDITNLVMLEFGHPMHAFDLDRVRGQTVRVRRATSGEKLRTLDAIDRELTTDDLVICDSEGPVALAGVMGGADSEIQPDTSRVLFECAVFEPRGVRRTARRFAMHTESSHRFERGVDPAGVSYVLGRALQLTAAFGGGEVAPGMLHVYGKDGSETLREVPRRTIRLRAHRIADVLGLSVPFREALEILQRLGCTIKSAADGTSEVLAPSHRPDLTREIDLVEEVVRVWGIDRVPTELPAVVGTRDVGGREELARRVRDLGVGLGLSEAITFGFCSVEELRVLGAPPPAVTLQNPLGEHHGVMRTSLLVGLLRAAAHARRHGERDVALFTVGPVFLEPAPDVDLPTERLRLGIVLGGERSAWLAKPRPVDVWDTKGLVEELLVRLGGRKVEVAWLEGEGRPGHLHPRGAAALVVDEECVGSFGPVHPDVLDAFELEPGIQVAEVDLELFLGDVKLPKYVDLPRFPVSVRDLAVVVDAKVPVGTVETAVRSAAGPLAEEVRLFDRFVGGSVPEGCASLAFRVVYRAADRTLTDPEVDGAHSKIVASISKELGATLRS